ncbi:glycosyltransferase [Chryseobacterium sp. CT-SW4]|uniref:glycosyltransferase n=1 Tax=Chryseobacterium sp. SW-1 TaxID=3157343 RepID=UPI003B01D9F7
MKILIPVVGVFGKAGGWRVLSKLASDWIDEGHEVNFLVYEQTLEPYFPTKANILYYDLNGNIRTKNNPAATSPFLGPLKLRSVLIKILNTLTADVVLANHCFSAYPVKKSKIEAKKFYYIQAYEPDYYYKKDLKTRIFKRISKKSYKLGLNMIVNAPMYLNYREIKTDMFVFPGLDMQNYRPSIEKTNKSAFIIGTIGRTEEYKGTKYIIEAFKILREKLGEKIELHVAFGDPHLEMEEGIKILKPDGDENLAKFYQSLDTYVCAGTVQLQAVHYPVIEAMACKIPVITTGYLPSSSLNAWIVPIKNSIEIANKVIEIMNEDSKQKVEKAYEDVKIFEWKNVSSKMITYFNRI